MREIPIVTESNIANMVVELARTDRSENDSLAVYIEKAQSIRDRLTQLNVIIPDKAMTPMILKSLKSSYP